MFVSLDKKPYICNRKQPKKYTDMDNNQKPENQFQIELKPEVADGVYANLAVISHSSSEFVLDFIRVLPGVPKGQVKSRVILTPEHAKRLMLALQENIGKYESTFGTIQLPEKKGMYMPRISDFKGEA